MHTFSPLIFANQLLKAHFCVSRFIFCSRNFPEFLWKNMEILFLKIHFYGGFMKKLQKIGPNLEHFSLPTL